MLWMHISFLDFTQITKKQSLDLDNFPKDAIVKQPPVEQPLRRDNLVFTKSVDSNFCAF